MPLKKKLTQTNKTEPQQQPTSSNEAKKTKSTNPLLTSSLAANFKRSSLSNNAKGVPQGIHEAIIREFVLQPPSAKGQSARLKLELCGPDFIGKKNTLTTWYTLEFANGEECEGGMFAFKLALTKLGYDPDNLEPEQYLEVLDEITNEHPGVLVKVGYSDPDENGQVWTRVRIEDTSDSDVVEAYRDNIPY
jgi:hypothetical protein